AHAAMVRPEQSYASGPEAANTYALPTWALAKSIAFWAAADPAWIGVLGGGAEPRLMYAARCWAFSWPSNSLYLFWSTSMARRCLSSESRCVFALASSFVAVFCAV